MPEYDGRFELETVYATTISSRTITHHHTFDIRMEEDYDPGESWTAMNVQPKNAANYALNDFVESYIGAWDTMMGSGTALSEIILWKYDPEPSQVKRFVASMPVLPTLTLTGTALAAQGAIFTFRTLGGQFPMRMYLMEPGLAGENRIPSGAFTGSFVAYRDAVIGDASPIVGRDDNYVISAIALNLGQNEKLRRIRFRSE